MVRFVRFYLEMCSPPQRRALFQHRNSQKWSVPLMFFTFWLRNVLRATTAFCAFWLGNVLHATMECSSSFLIWPNGSAPAALASLLFHPPAHKSLEKRSVLRLSWHFARLYLLSSDSFSFSLLLFSFLPLSSLWLFPSVLFISPYCPKFDFQTSFGQSYLFFLSSFVDQGLF